MKYVILFFALFAFTFTACKHAHEDEKHDEQEEQSIQFTAYSNEFELFAEADPFVAGQSSNILSHFSNLPSFKALEKGSITIRLVVDGKETNQTLDKATRKGIYSFDLKAETIGTGEIVYDIKTENGDFQLIVPGITVYDTEQKANEAARIAELSKTNTTVFTKEQSWKIEFATEYPVREVFGQVIKTTALIESAQGDEILVSAKTNGIVILSTDNVLEGKGVFKGQVLLSLSGSGLANNSAVLFEEAENNYEKAKSDYKRLSELAEDKIVSEKELLSARNEYENTEAIYNNLRKNFDSSGQIVKSPMKGFINQVYVQNGQYIEAGQPIVSILQNKTLVLHADVQQKYSSILGSINSANIRTLHNNKTYTFEELNGKLLSFGKTTNKDNFLIPVRLQIDNPDNFISGGFVEIYLKTLTDTQALTVPNTALLEEQGFYYVFVQITPELFEKREVKTGASDGLKTEILKGVSQNERVVTKGVILVKLALASGTLDAHSGHVH